MKKSSSEPISFRSSLRGQLFWAASLATAARWSVFSSPRMTTLSQFPRAECSASCTPGSARTALAIASVSPLSSATIRDGPVTDLRSCSVVPAAAILPAAITIRWSHVCSTSARMWLDRITVWPPRSERISSRIARICAGSSPMVGSSRISTSGSCRSTSASPTRCLYPRESSPRRRRIMSWGSESQQRLATRPIADFRRFRGMSRSAARNIRYSRTRISGYTGTVSGM